MRPGKGDWELGLKLWSIAGNNVISDRSTRSKSLLGLKKRLRSLTRKSLKPLLKSSRGPRLRSQRGAYDDEGASTAPTIDSGAVTRAVGGLVVVGSPAVAKVQIFGAKEKGWSLQVGDSLGSLPIGTYRWRAEAPGFLDAKGTVKVVPDRFESLRIQLQEPATLSLKGTPVRAKATLIGPDGQELEPTGLPSTLRNLPSGRYRLTVSKKGYETRKKWVELRPGKREVVSVRLFRRARLEVDGGPKGAKVVVESPRLGFRREGGLPWRAKGLRTGTYQVTVSRSGYQSQRQRVVLVAGDHRQVNVRLKRGRDPVHKPGALQSRWGYPMVAIQGGKVRVGSPKDEPGRDSDETQHEVVLSRPFAMGATEVTQAQYEALMKTNPSTFKGPNRPVEQVNWFDVIRFANRASQADGLEPCYHIDARGLSWPKGLACTGYRLPTEAEWEVVARAGSKHSYSGSDRLDEVAWFDGNSGGETHPVAQKKPNAWGCYDMSGNVWEWVWDGYGPYPKETVKDPVGHRGSEGKVIRGGSWGYGANNARVAVRFGDKPQNRYAYLGFRLARTLP